MQFVAQLYMYAILTHCVLFDLQDGVGIDSNVYGGFSDAHYSVYRWSGILMY